jgi:AraC-like DNA-binding protein
MVVKRDPRPELRPFVKTLWASEPSGEASVRSGLRERVLPTGDMHIAFRLNRPLRLFRDVDDVSGETIGHAVIGGVRETFCVKEISTPVCTVGAQLRIGAAEMLFGIPAEELAGRHTLLDDVWGRSAALILEQLSDARACERQLDIFESILIARLPAVRRLHPAVAHALERLEVVSHIQEIVRETGYSHRRFITLFRREVGLTPKVFRRILRFQTAIDRVTADSAGADWAGLALDVGYSDKSHFNREFREFAGVTPEEYRRIAPSSANHLPILHSSR